MQCNHCSSVLRISPLDLGGGIPWTGAAHQLFRSVPAVPRSWRFAGRSYSWWDIIFGTVPVSSRGRNKQAPAVRQCSNYITLFTNIARASRYRPVGQKCNWPQIFICVLFAVALLRNGSTDFWVFFNVFLVGISFNVLCWGSLFFYFISGMLYDYTNSYDISFIVSGSFFLLSAVICYPVDRISRWEKSRAKLNGNPKVWPVSSQNRL